VSLSRGGADAKVVREFDTVAKRFVDGGFELPEAKTSVDWLDADTLYVGTDFGPGSLTDSGYPRVIKRWRAAAAGRRGDGVRRRARRRVGVAWVDHTPGFERTASAASPTSTQPAVPAAARRLQVPLDKPIDAKLRSGASRLLIQLRSDWAVAGATWPRGSLLVADAAAYLRR
jgi:prolyl oligopeptidase